MPSPRAVLADIVDFDLDPCVEHKVLSKGRLSKKEQLQILAEVKESLPIVEEVAAIAPIVEMVTPAVVENVPAVEVIEPPVVVEAPLPKQALHQDKEVKKEKKEKKINS